MDNVYKEIWELAKPYYIEGRPIDIGHIEWMSQKAEVVCENENLDKTLLIPLVILHDVGYSQVPKGRDYSFEEVKIIHMGQGKNISKDILEKVSYPKDKAEKISYYVSVHDNWALGDDEVFKKDRILAAFGDLDFIWITTKEGFADLSKVLNKNNYEMVEFLETNDKLVKRPFCTETTKQLFEVYLEERKAEIGVF